MMFLFASASAWLVDRYRASVPPPGRAGAWERRLGLVSALQRLRLGRAEPGHACRRQRRRDGNCSSCWYWAPSASAPPGR
ncbi:MAG: hypothetical protein MZW92_75665 [Comamonadaceae bacterium]|nr:hypothetical protein [Comamonadaceae bacterium]